MNSADPYLVASGLSPKLVPTDPPAALDAFRVERVELKDRGYHGLSRAHSGVEKVDSAFRPLQRAFGAKSGIDFLETDRPKIRF